MKKLAQKNIPLFVCKNKPNVLVVDLSMVTAGFSLVVCGIFIYKYSLYHVKDVGNFQVKLNQEVQRQRFHWTEYQFALAIDDYYLMLFMDFLSQYCPINQSNLFTTNIPGKARLSSVTAKSLFNSKINEAVPLYQQTIGRAVVYGRKVKSKRCVLRCFLKAATVMTERTVTGRLFQRDRAQDWKALVSVLASTLETDRLIPLFDLSERDGSAAASVECKQAVFHEWFCRSTNWSWTILTFTGNLWREQSSGTLQVTGADFVTRRAIWFWIYWKFGEVSVRDAIQQWIAIIAATRHKTNCKLFLRSPDQGNSECSADPRYGKSMSYRLEKTGINIKYKIYPFIYFFFNLQICEK